MDELNDQNILSLKNLRLNHEQLLNVTLSADGRVSRSWAGRHVDLNDRKRGRIVEPFE